MKTYKIEIGFGGYLGVSNTYEEFADDRDEAINMALSEAADDLEVIDVEEEDDETN